MVRVRVLVCAVQCSVGWSLWCVVFLCVTGCMVAGHIVRVLEGTTACLRAQDWPSFLAAQKVRIFCTGVRVLVACAGRGVLPARVNA